MPIKLTCSYVGTQSRRLVNWFRKGGIALDQYVFAAATRSALPGVKGDRNSRISPYPLELLPYPDRAVEHRQRARGSITKGEVRQRRQDDATRGADVPERHDTVAPEDVIDRVRPRRTGVRNPARRLSFHADPRYAGIVFMPGLVGRWATVVPLGRFRRSARAARRNRALSIQMGAR